MDGHLFLCSTFRVTLWTKEVIIHACLYGCTKRKHKKKHKIMHDDTSAFSGRFFPPKTPSLWIVAFACMIPLAFGFPRKEFQIV
jgi:hypothetical protein